MAVISHGESRRQMLCEYSDVYTARNAPRVPADDMDMTPDGGQSRHVVSGPLAADMVWIPSATYRMGSDVHIPRSVPPIACPWTGSGWTAPR